MAGPSTQKKSHSRGSSRSATEPAPKPSRPAVPLEHLAFYYDAMRQDAAERLTANLRAGSVADVALRLQGLSEESFPTTVAAIRALLKVANARENISENPSRTDGELLKPGQRGVGQKAAAERLYNESLDVGNPLHLPHISPVVQ